MKKQSDVTTPLQRKKGVTVEIKRRPAKKVDLNLAREAFAKKEITNYESLIKFGVRKFNKLHFENLGYARSLTGKIIGKVLRTVTEKDIEQIAEKFGWTNQPKKVPTDKEKVVEIRKFLALYGIIDYWTLLYKYSEVCFRKVSRKKDDDSDFFSCEFFSYRSMRTIQTREDLASSLGWKKPTSKQKNERYKLELRNNGLVTYFDIMRIDWRDFIKINFGVFGRGVNFLRIVLEYDSITIRGHKNDKGKKWIKGLERLKEELVQKLGIDKNL